VLGCDNAVVEAVDWHQQAGPDGRVRLSVVARVRPGARQAGRCGICGKKAPGYDQGGRRRRWRALDLGTVTAWLEADAPRVSCRQHGVVTAAVPWARHGAGHTRFFDEQVAWLAAACSKTTVTQLMGISWRTVGNIVERVCADQLAAADMLQGLRRIGIDEISYKKGYKYLTVVVDHDSGRLVWAAPGKDKATVRTFFDALGEERSAQLTHVSADGAEWIAAVVAERAPAAVLCADPFHVVSWATQALDEVRRQAWRHARDAGQVTALHRRSHAVRASASSARDLGRARYALWKNPENLTTSQHAKLAWIAKTHPRLYRAWLLKEGLRLAFQLKGQEGKHALSRWLKWAARCRIPEFTSLARRIRQHHLPAIHATLDHGLSNGLIESVNTKIRLITRVAFGFHGPAPLIALAMLTLGGLRPALPAR
jgi:transposase